MDNRFIYPADEQIDAFLTGKTNHTLMLFHTLLLQFNRCGNLYLHPAKSMIGIANGNHKKIAWITRLGKDFIHVVFPLPLPFSDHFCFQKIVQVPGDSRQFNHHLRIYHREDLNDEVTKFMKMAYDNITPL